MDQNKQTEPFSYNHIAANPIFNIQQATSPSYMFPGHDSAGAEADELQAALESLVEDSCPSKRHHQRRLNTAEFQSNNETHLKIVKEMGISIVRLPDGRVQLLHTAASAVSSQAGEEGLLFMQEMIELSRQQTSPAPDSPPKLVTFPGPAGNRLRPQAGPAQFGPELLGGHTVTGPLVAADLPSAAQQNGVEMSEEVQYPPLELPIFESTSNWAEEIINLQGFVSPTYSGATEEAEPAALPGLVMKYEEAETLGRGEEELCITYLDFGPAKFWVGRAAGRAELLQAISWEAAQLAGQGKLLPLDSRQPGQPCLALYCDGIWYRGLVLNPLERATGWNIRYVDFGNTGEVGGAGLAAIPPGLVSRAPAQALPCRLAGNQHWPDTATQQFVAMAGERFTVALEAVESGVAVVQATSSTGKSINTKL